MNFLLNIILCLINASLMVYLYVLFFSSFDRFRYKGSLTFLFATIITLLFTALLLFVKIPILKFLLFTCLTILTSLLVKLKWYKSLLFSGLAYALVMITEAFVTFLLSSIFSISNQQAVKGPFFVLGLLLSKALLFFLIILIKNFVKQSPISTSWKKILAILIIPASTIVVMILQYNYFIKANEYDISDTVLTLLCFSFLLASNFVVLELINHIYQDAEKDKQLTIANKLIRSQNDNYQHLLQHNRDIQRIRHDYKNFLIGVLSDLKNNNYEKLACDLEQECDRLNMISQSENNLNIIDYIVNIKSQQAQEHHIQINYTPYNLNTIKISSIDLSIIIGNALDNAIEATAKLKNQAEKEISIFAKHHNNHIVIIIKNNVDTDIDINNISTTKNDPTNHGFGLIEMKALVKKHNGNLLITCENKVFELHIVLSNQENE